MCTFDGDRSDPPDFDVKVTFYHDPDGPDGATGEWDFTEEYAPRDQRQSFQHDKFITYHKKDTNSKNLYFIGEEPINDAGRFVKIKIRLLDKDGSNYNTVDITQEFGICSLILYYDCYTGLWSDIEPGQTQRSPMEGAYFDESLGENGKFQIEDLGWSKSDGLGFSTGYGDDDGLYGAGIYFEIFPWKEGAGNSVPGDKDNDGLGTLAEAEFWGTDPDDEDSDNDGFPDWYDKAHGIFANKGHWWPEILKHPFYGLNGNKKYGDTDKDNDGIEDIDEYKFRYFGANPGRQDIFVEVDWAENYKITDYEKFVVTQGFQEKNIGLHIDDGLMGYGNKIKGFPMYLDYDKAEGSDQWGMSTDLLVHNAKSPHSNYIYREFGDFGDRNGIFHY